ncbi:corrinoid protein [Wukongibacter baidiensis]|uniref:corrinoid protein n=1 Tax=Wukongibacter baidiensis TaxID=1723361 RepID=UPI003D7FF5A5
MELNQICTALQKGAAIKVQELVKKALGEGVEAKTILEEGLLSAMEVIGKKFKDNEIFVPEVLIAARAMNAGMNVLEPSLIKAGNKALGKVVIGTVQGDLHDIGKNLVAMMMKGAGLEIYDIGTNASAEQFIKKAEEVQADIICMSALLTTTMAYMRTVINELEKRCIRDKYVVMVGGAPVNDKFAKQIGANIYTADASTAAETAKEILIA